VLVGVRKNRQVIEDRWVAFVRGHRGWFWCALAAYAAAVTFPHEWVQTQCSALAIRITHVRLWQLSAVVGFIEVAAFTALLARKLAGHAQRRFVLGLWAMTLALILFAWRMFTANNLELVHYPQYFPEGMLLAILTLSPADTLSWIAILGGLDEGYQYWVLSRGRPTVFDFNDIYMDLLGGAAGMVFAMAFVRLSRRRPGTGVLALVSTLAAGAVLWMTGRMLPVEDAANRTAWFGLGRLQAPSFWVQVQSNGPYHYHTLTPLEGVVMISVTIALYTMLCRRQRAR